MYNDLYNACEFAKYAADMTIPVEAKPVPEAGSQVVQGMVDASRVNPVSVGAQTMADPIQQKALQEAVMESAKVAAINDAYMAGVYDGAYDYYTKTAAAAYSPVTAEEAYAAMADAENAYAECLEKMAYAEGLYAEAADYLQKVAADYATTPETAFNVGIQGQIPAPRQGEPAAQAQTGGIYDKLKGYAASARAAIGC